MRSLLGTVLSGAVLLVTGCGATARPASTPAPAAPTTTTPTTAGPGRAAGSERATGPCGWASPPPTYDHVIWIWMENHSASSVLGSRDAPYENGLAAACGSSTLDGAVGSPSLPNYIGATSGGTSGIADDAEPASHPLRVDNLFRQVRAAGRTERSFAEAMPHPCATQSAGEYGAKHNPAAYYVGGGDRAACQADDLPLGDLSGGALAAAIDADALPAFTFVTPDLCNDTHDCSVATGDRWLQRWIPRIVDSPAWRRGRTVLFVVWDEPTPMPLLVIAPSVAPGSRATARTDHYALLRTTEELLGLPLLGRAAGAADLRGPFRL